MKTLSVYIDLSSGREGVEQLNALSHISQAKLKSGGVLLEMNVFICCKHPDVQEPGAELVMQFR